jgi:hypothetical protein
MGIPRNAQVQQIADRLITTACRDRSFPYETPQCLGDLEIQEVRGMQGFGVGINSPLNALSRRCLKKPVDCGGGVEDDQGASRSSRTMRPVSSCTETGLR